VSWRIGSAVTLERTETRIQLQFSAVIRWRTYVNSASRYLLAVASFVNLLCHFTHTYIGSELKVVILLNDALLIVLLGPI
jgi:hypothetical protein